jgi:deoxyribonuclease IV
MTRTDELGAHVSAAGGTHKVPGRAAELDSVVLQLFTKQPSRWAEREVGEAEERAFRAECRAHGIQVTASHDSYLINLATADPVLYQRSLDSFIWELRRAEALGLTFVVTHPGNATAGDVDRAIERNAAAISDALDLVPGSTRVLLEGTAGTGTALGGSFQQLARIMEPVAASHPDRIGVCLDTCHLWAAGHDLHDLDGVLHELDRVLGLPHLRFMHLNDSATPFASRRDRHADIGTGTLGDTVFRAVMTHPALTTVPKVIETPKGDDALAADRANLARLRALRAGPPA